ncbi:rod shape-determining protein MreC [Merdimmobilis hominis]|jgi:rod shape-determining protein MreC|uniref:Cell shape-determining protein MreC n=1 Tax=uncultured Anaerotruncus sp. TaxID=905011 RepID=A0A6N2V1I5_9FIRM|nr:rod shape-determining protein MreC [Merdimmobilis hominis]MCD4836919.1 rod shape-determining protein MreC [Merdimmobilis hominis]PWL61713.1 MAG: rod shape-determining protein MreC [Oscillospiraceae bacterium]
MGDFFKSIRFKILVAVLAFLLAFMLRAAYTGGLAPMTSQILGILTNPLQKASASVSASFSGLFDRMFRSGEILEENERLKEENRRLTQRQLEFDKYKLENEQLKEYLDIKEKNPDFDFETAFVIGRDPNDRFYAFTIDKGSLDGISLHDPVITEDGLVGMVVEVGPTYAKVATILDVMLEISSYDSRTKDIGITTGRIDLAEEGLCQLTLLQRESGASAGDIVITSNVGGLYPKDLVIGTIREVRTESHGISLYAVIEPAVDVRTVKDVLVITSFEGQASAAE